MKKCLLPLLCFVITSTFCEAQSPILWGMTPYGGMSNNGTIFSYSTSNETEIVQHCFDDTDGAISFGSLMIANNGLLYGMCNNGGTGNAGVLFSYDMVTGIERVAHSFLDNGNDGFYPESSLIQGNNGLLYGLTQDGGNLGGGGTIFSLDIVTGAETILHSFGSTGDGRLPANSLIQANNGLLYGTAPYGGNHNSGVIFSYNISSGSEMGLYSFDNDTDGSLPESSLVQAADSLLYGTAEMGGNNDKGVIFSYNTSTGIYNKVYDFGGNNDGTYPHCTLLNASNGLLYGVTTEGGISGLGTIFNYDILTGNEAVLYNFGSDSDGASPAGSLMQASNGLLYAMTTQGGGSDGGTIISYNILNGKETVVNRFNGSTTGEFSIGATNGNLVEVNSPTSIPQISRTSNQLQISPNPSTGQFIIQLPGTQSDYPTEVYNMLGQKVEQHTLSTAQNTLNLSNQAAGMYFVYVQTDAGTVTGKVVVTK